MFLEFDGKEKYLQRSARRARRLVDVVLREKRREERDLSS